jgi:hypothetical protein
MYNDHGTKKQTEDKTKFRKRDKSWRPQLNCQHEMDVRLDDNDSLQDISLASETVTIDFSKLHPNGRGYSLFRVARCA